MTVPFDRVIWDAQECAEYLRLSYKTFVQKTQFLEGFPPYCHHSPSQKARAVRTGKDGRAS